MSLSNDELNTMYNANIGEGHLAALRGVWVCGYQAASGNSYVTDPSQQVTISAASKKPPKTHADGKS